MTTRLCVIGNSHTACIKLAADDAGPSRAGIDFFAVSANRMEALGLHGHEMRLSGNEGRHQFRAVAGGKEAIDVRNYDAFAFVGIGFEYRDFLRVFRTHCLYRHRAWRAGRDLISDAAFEAVQRGHFGWRPAYRLVREIATVRPGATMLLVASPCPTEAFVRHKAQRLLRSLIGTGYFDETAALYRSCATAAAHAVGASISFQNAATLAAPGFTAPRFNDRPVGLAGKPGSGLARAPGLAEKVKADPWHMNVTFGQVRLADICRDLGLPVPALVAAPSLSA